MPRRIEGPPPGAEYWFVPTSFGNDEAPDDDQVRVKLRYPTEADKRNADRAGASTTFDFNADGKIITNEDGTYSIRIKDSDAAEGAKALLVAHVVEVAGYVGRGDIPITTGGELFEHGETEIVDDVVMELRTGLALKASEKKSSTDLPALLSQEQSSSDGVARNAESSDCKRAEVTVDLPERSSR